MSNHQTQTVQSFFELLGVCNQARAIAAAYESGIFAQLSTGQKSVQELSAALALHADRVSAFLQFLIHTGMVEQFGEDYALSTAARMIPAGLFQMNQDLWQKLPQWLMESPDSTNGRVEEQAALLEQYRSLFDWTQTPAALDVIEVLGIGVERKGLNILDLFCGPAIFSMAMAHRDPQAFVTCLDSGRGLARAKETAESVGTLQRCEFLEATPNEDLPLEQKYDLVILIDQLHSRSAESCQALFQLSHSSLRESGELLIVDTFGGQTEGDVCRLTMELELAMSEPTQQIKSIKQTNEWLNQAGFDNARFAQLPSPPSVRGAILAAK